MIENKFNQIITDCKKRIEANPRDFFAYYQLARALELSGDTDMAIKVFRDAITINPKDAYAHNFVGLAYRNKGMLDEAIVEFKKANATIKNGEFINFYSTIIEKRVVAKDGIVGYGATEKVKNGDKLAVFFGGYLDGLSRSISTAQ